MTPPSIVPCTLPLLATHIAAGFPSPADDYVDEELNIHDWLVQHPAATFFMRVSGNALAPHHIKDGDTLVVDRSLTPYANDMVVVETYGELVVQPWQSMHLQEAEYGKSEDEHGESMVQQLETQRRANGEEQLVVWGVVCGIVRKLK